MFETAMIATTLSVMYLTAWSYRRHTSMAGLVYLIVAVIATAFIGVEFIFCMIRFDPPLHWAAEAGIITAVTTLVTTCLLFDEMGRRAKVDEEKWGNKSR